MTAYHRTHVSRPQSQQSYPDQHKADIISTLRHLGADTYDLLLPETCSLPALIGPNEVVEGIVYGRYRLSTGAPPGRGVMVATNERIIFLDHKPLFTRTSEITYDVLSAVTHSHVGFMGYVTVNTRMGDINVRTFNTRCAENFVQAVEKHLFNRRGYDDHTT